MSHDPRETWLESEPKGKDKPMRWRGAALGERLSGAVMGRVQEGIWVRDWGEWVMGGVVFESGKEKRKSSWGIE